MARIPSASPVTDATLTRIRPPDAVSETCTPRESSPVPSTRPLAMTVSAPDPELDARIPPFSPVTSAAITETSPALPVLFA